MMHAALIEDGGGGGAAAARADFLQKQWDEAGKDGALVLIDNSNMFIESKKTGGGMDHRVRVNVGKLIKLIQTQPGFPKSEQHGAIQPLLSRKVQLFGSIPPPSDDVWKKFEEQGVTVHLKKRSVFNRREKMVDAALAGMLTADAFTIANHEQQFAGETVMRVYVVISGDGDFIPSIEHALFLGYPVQLWSFREPRARAYMNLKERFPDLFTTFDLDTFVDKFTFSETSWVETKAIPAERTIAFQQGENATDAQFGSVIDEFMTSCAYDCNYAQVFELRGMRASLVIFCSEIDVDFYAILLDAAKSACGNTGVSAISFIEFKQHNPSWRENKQGGATLVHRAIATALTDSDSDSASASDSSSDADGWRVAGKDRRQKRDAKMSKKMHKKAKKGTKPCWSREFCQSGLQCSFYHSPEEIDIFKRRGGSGYRRLKKKLCVNPGCADVVVKSECPFRHHDEGELCCACLSTEVGHTQGSPECKRRAERRDVISMQQLKSLQERKYIARV